MVKRTAVVLGVFALMIMAAGTSLAFVGGCGNVCAPMYLPAECPPAPDFKIISKTWECNIVGPCPAVTPPACGSPCGTGLKYGTLLGIANIIGAPFDLLFGGCDGVYACDAFGGGKGGPCDPGWGPIPGVLGGFAGALGAPCDLFGTLW